MADVEKYELLNESAKAWAKLNATKMKRLVGTLTLRNKIAVYKAVRAAIKSKEYKPLASSIGGAIKKESGQVNRINFRFAKQGIWFEHGVGKGRRRGSAGANPKPWIAPILDNALDDLADLLSSDYADIAAGEIKFVIPGIIDRRIKINNG
jgi:hypothetical protein